MPCGDASRHPCGEQTRSPHPRFVAYTPKVCPRGDRQNGKAPPPCVALGRRGFYSGWRVRDSNPRRQCQLIYSQPPLAARVTRRVRTQPTCSADRRRDQPYYPRPVRTKNRLARWRVARAACAGHSATSGCAHAAGPGCRNCDHSFRTICATKSRTRRAVLSIFMSTLARYSFGASGIARRTFSWHDMSEQMYVPTLLP